MSCMIPTYPFLLNTIYEDFSPAAHRLNPYAVDAYDGVNLNPLEVVFVKVKGFLLQTDWPAPKISQTYDRWLSHQVGLHAFAGHHLVWSCIGVISWLKALSNCLCAISWLQPTVLLPVICLCGSSS